MNKVQAAMLGGVVLLLAGVAYITVAADSPEAKQRRAEAEAITQCRALADDELQELADRREIRARCETLETAYRAKWGRAP
jgi:hypothetical protein